MKFIPDSLTSEVWKCTVWRQEEIIYKETSLHFSGIAKVQQFSFQVILIESYLMTVGCIQDFKKRQDLEEDVLHYADTHITEYF